MSNLALNLVDSAQRHPDRIAVITKTAKMTYAEVDAAVARLATLLHCSGIRVGDRVGAMLPNIAAAPISYYAIWRAGAIAVPMNPLLQAGEVQFQLANTAARLLIGSLGFATRSIPFRGAWGTLRRSHDFGAIAGPPRPVAD